MIQLGLEDPRVQMILLHLEFQVPLVAPMVQRDRKILAVREDLQVLVHLWLLLFPARHYFQLVQVVLVDQQILAFLVDQENQVDLEALKDLIQKFRVFPMVRVAQIDQVVLCHPADQQVLMDQVDRKNQRVLATLVFLIAPTVLVVLVILYLQQALKDQSAQVVLDNQRVQVDLADFQVDQRYQSDQ